VHPRTRARLEETGLLTRARSCRHMSLLEPQSYRASLSLMAASRFVLTDSGGVQDETSYLQVPCLTLRPNTERPITTTLGTNTLVGEDLGRARELVDTVLSGGARLGRPIRSAPTDS
jgi:UDP-N-acetylglucosamine 2-epimerase (non-hydrolysing)